MVKQTNRRNKQSKVGKLAKKVGKTRQTVARRVLTAGQTGQNGQTGHAGQLTMGPSCDLIFKIISQHANGKSGNSAFKKLAQHYYNRVKPVSGRAERCKDVASEMYWTVDLMNKQIIADSPVYRRLFELVFPPGLYDLEGRPAPPNNVNVVQGKPTMPVMPVTPFMPAHKMHQIKPQML